MLDDESPTSANLGNVGNVHEFIIRPLGGAQSKVMRAYAQSGQYHTIVKSRVYLTYTSRVYLTYATNCSPKMLANA